MVRQPQPTPLGDHAPNDLATEHWNLLSTRSLIWSESFNRLSVFLNTLSASIVALALVANTSGFDGDFRIFAFVLFPIVFFLGLATYVRIVQVGLEDIHLVAAMNRLRRAYVDDEPEIRDYFTTGISDDEAGVWTTFLLDQPRTLPSWAQSVVTTPTVVATLDAVIATVGAGVFAIHLGGTGAVVVLVCVGVFVATWAGLFSLQLRAFNMVRRTIARFPSWETEGQGRR
jgi:hypothetical protein